MAQTTAPVADVIARDQALMGKEGSATAAVMTWKSLQAEVVDVKGNSKLILDNITGYLEPTHLLAIMGPSGSGKTTLLDTLAGRLSHKVNLTGEILINGHKSKLSYGVSAYVTQDEMHVGTLTVRESLRYVAQLRLPHSDSHQSKMARVEEVLGEMGLQSCADTQIGNWHISGISGGQARRLSIAGELITHPTLLFLDEPTSGLDSASAYHVVAAIRQLANKGRTILTSLHQPSSEVFEVFDYLCLLSTGRVVYFGDTAGAEPLFAAAGLSCPAFRNPADHFMHCINPDFVEGKALHTFQQHRESLLTTYQTTALPQVESRVASLSVPGVPYQGNSNEARWLTQTVALTRRTFANNARNIGVFWVRVAMYTMLCLCIGTVYFNLDKSWNAIIGRTGMLFYSCAFLTFMSISGFPSFGEDMQVFLRERLNGYYGVGSFVIGNTLASAPFLLLITLLSTVLIYWTAGLDDSGDRVPYFMLDLYLSLLCVESLMMAIAAVMPHYLMGFAAGAGLLGMFMLVAGYFQPVGDLPAPIWRYPMHYIGYHTFSFDGFMKNEFVGTKGWGCPCELQPGGCEDKSCTQTGKEVLKAWGTSEHSKWVDLGIIGGMSVLYRAFFFMALKFMEYWKTR